jgi:hypothetical protein
MTDRCAPPAGTPPGTKCLLWLDDNPATITYWWWHDEEWRSSPGGPWIGGHSVEKMSCAGWRFVHVAGGEDDKR